MATSFACPDCGCRIRPVGSTPGREVICPACATRVVVPFLPRAVKTQPEARTSPPKLRRSGRWGRSARQRRQVRWALALGAVALVALGTAWTVARLASGARRERERVVADLVEASARAEQAHDIGGAFREIEAALIRARQVDPPGSSRLAELRDRRDRLARAEVAARLAALTQGDPDRAVGEALILADRGGRDPALAPLAEAIAAGVQAAKRRQVEADRDQARADLGSGQGGAAFERAARAFRRADGLHDRAAARCLRDEAQALAAEAVGRFGVVLQPPATGDDFATPLWLDALAAHGYLIEPAGSAWGDLWATRAPYRAQASVAESASELYQQSQNRATRIEARFTLHERGRTTWDNRIFAQTRSPILDLPAFLAGRLATATRRDPEIERRLRDDARAAFRLQAERILRGVPPAGAPLPPPAPAPPAAGLGDRST